MLPTFRSEFDIFFSLHELGNKFFYWYHWIALTEALKTEVDKLVSPEYDIYDEIVDDDVGKCCKLWTLYQFWNIEKWMYIYVRWILILTPRLYYSNKISKQWKLVHPYVYSARPLCEYDKGINNKENIN